MRWRRSLPTEKAFVARSGEDDDADGRPDRDRLDDLGEAGAHLGRDRVVRVRPVEGDQRDTTVGEVVDEDRGLRFLAIGRGWAEVERLPTVGGCHGFPLFSIETGHESSSASQRIARRPGAKQYSPPRVTTNGGRFLSRRRIGRSRNGEAARPVVRPDERVLLERGADEDAVVEPLGLDELELPLEVRAREDEDDAAIGAVVFEHALGQHRPVARAAPDHAVQADVDGAVAVQRVARIRAPCVRTQGALEASRIVAVEERVVALRVVAEIRVVTVRGERERSAALPAPDHLRAEQRLLLAARRLRPKVLPVGRDPRVQLPEDDVRAVAAEHLRGRHRRQLARLVRVAEDDLARLERPLLRIRGGPAAPLDRRLADPVLEAEGRPPARELVAVLAPDHLDARKLRMRAARLLDHGLQPLAVRGERRQSDVDVAGAERLLPVLRTAVADIAQQRRAGRHPLSELRREAVERALRDAERLQAVIGEGGRDPGVVGGIGRGSSAVDDVVQSPHELASGGAVVDAEQEVRPGVR